MNTMSAVASRSEFQRAWGDLRVTLRVRDGRTVLEDLRQDGCLKARFPRPVDLAEVTTLNTSGGVAGGDRLRLAFEVGAGAAACFASQAAERFYRALPEDAPARLRSTVRVAAGGLAEWLPQESILFDRCALDRVLEVDMAADARFIGVESLVFGRALMGETVRAARLADTIRIRRDGRLLLHDAIRLDGDLATAMARPAIGAGAGAVATLLYVAPDAPARLDALRAAWAAGAVEGAVEGGASCWDGMLVGRLVARDGAALRAAVASGLECLRDGRALPRVWMC